MNEYRYRCKATYNRVTIDKLLCKTAMCAFPFERDALIDMSGLS